MATTKNDAGRWAVCPIDFDDPRGPRYFNSEDDALAFFTEQRVDGKAPEWLLPIPVVSRATSHTGGTALARLDEISLPVSSSAPPPFILAERPPEWSEDGSAVSRGERSLIHRSVTREEILRSSTEQIHGIFEASIPIECGDAMELSGTLEDEIALALVGYCCLEEDWRHSEIETLARQLPGNDLRRQRSIRESIVIAMRDYDTARTKIWPHSSSSELADFWRSWQTHRYLICFGDSLTRCEAARALAGGAEAARDAVNEAVNCVSLELARYANSLEAGGALVATVAISRTTKKNSATSPQHIECPLPASPEVERLLADVSAVFLFNPRYEVCRFHPEEIVARHFDLTDGQKWLYSRMVRWARANDGKRQNERAGELWRSQKNMAVELKKSARQIRRDLARLEAVGLITRRKRDGRKSDTYAFLHHPSFERTSTSGQTPDAAAPCPVVSGHPRPLKSDLSGHPRPTNQVINQKLESSSIGQHGRGEASTEATTTSEFLRDDLKPARRDWTPDEIQEAREALQRNFGSPLLPDLSLTFQVLTHMNDPEDVRLWLLDLVSRRVRPMGWGLYLTDAATWPTRRPDVAGQIAAARVARAALTVLQPAPVTPLCPHCQDTGIRQAADQIHWEWCSCEDGERSRQDEPGAVAEANAAVEKIRNLNPGRTG